MKWNGQRHHKLGQSNKNHMAWYRKLCHSQLWWWQLYDDDDNEITMIRPGLKLKASTSKRAFGGCCKPCESTSSGACSSLVWLSTVTGSLLTADSSTVVHIMWPSRDPTKCRTLVDTWYSRSHFMLAAYSCRMSISVPRNTNVSSSSSTQLCQAQAPNFHYTSSTCCGQTSAPTTAHTKYSVTAAYSNVNFVMCPCNLNLQLFK